MSEAEQITPPSSREVVFDEINRLNLQDNVLELEEKGYTMVEDALPKDMVEKMREVIIDQTADKSGVERPDLKTWNEGQLREGCYLLFEDPIFERVALNEYLSLIHI